MLVGVKRIFTQKYLKFPHDAVLGLVLSHSQHLLFDASFHGVAIIQTVQVLPTRAITSSELAVSCKASDRHLLCCWTLDPLADQDTRSDVGSRLDLAAGRIWGADYAAAI